MIEIARKAQTLLSHNLRNVSFYFLDLSSVISALFVSSFSFTSPPIFVNFEKLQFKKKIVNIYYLQYTSCTLLQTAGMMMEGY